jgi:hypothetical protein
MRTNSLTITGPSPNYWDVYWKDRIHKNVQNNDLKCINCEKLYESPGNCFKGENSNICMKSISVYRIMEEVKNVIEGRWYY